MKKDNLLITPAALSALGNGDIDNFMVAATPGGIEAQEAAGQKALCNASELPRDFNCCKKEDFERMGIKFLSDPATLEDAKDIFVKVELPAGWKIVPTSHSMWSDLVDGKGRKRAAIFYKAAFYDRNAHISAVCRYAIESQYEIDEAGNKTPNGDYFRCAIIDGDEAVIWQSRIVSHVNYGEMGKIRNESVA